MWLESIIGWFVSKVLDKIISIFSKKKKQEIQNQSFIDLLIEENRNLKQDVETKNKKIEEALSDKEKTEKDYSYVITSLKRKGISKENLVKKYSKPLPIIIFQYANQKVDGKNFKFIKTEIEKNYGSKNLGGALSIIPPSKVPKNLSTRKDLEEWFEKEIYSKYQNAKCIISLLAVIDLKNIYWKKDYDYETNYKTIGEVLEIEDIFSIQTISEALALSQISIVDPIIAGDIGFLASRFMNDKDLKKIHDNQQKIEDTLKNPSLKDLATDSMLSNITTALSSYFDNSEEISKQLISEAKFWVERLC